MLDLDQLRTFVAIAESGSFTKAADNVHKTQSAVSMQMRRLEERIGKPLFVRVGRQSRLTEHGERLLHYARRLVQLNDETLAAFDDTELAGLVRLGTPDDYADRFLPEILARFSRSNPKAEVSVVCAPTPNLADMIGEGELDVAIITHVQKKGRKNVEILRREPLLWVASARHATENEAVLPMALGRATCDWRKAALMRWRISCESTGFCIPAGIQPLSALQFWPAWRFQFYRNLLAFRNAGSDGSGWIFPAAGLRDRHHALLAQQFPRHRCFGGTHHVVTRQSFGSAGGRMSKN
jgi:DNA-binding transcriptional LysR family regulator